jgi:hypothetical protein
MALPIELGACPLPRLRRQQQHGHCTRQSADQQADRRAGQETDSEVLRLRFVMIVLVGVVDQLALRIDNQVVQPWQLACPPPS